MTSMSLVHLCYRVIAIIIGDYKMFIKLPSGVIFQIEKIVRCAWNKDNELLVTTSESDEAWTLKDEDAKRLYEYLESIAIA